LRLGVLLLVVVALAGCSLGSGDDEKSAVDGAEIVFDLVPALAEDPEPLGRGGLAGSNEQAEIIIDLEDPPEERMVADLRRGGCATGVRSAAEYPLQDVVDGESRTRLDLPLAELKSGDYIVIIRRPTQETVIDAICGDVAVESDF
jgi:hypothetical protein